MIVIFGKWKVGNWIAHLLHVLSIPYSLMDDQDIDFNLLDTCDTILVSPGIKQSHVIYEKYPSKVQSELNFLGFLLPSLGFLSKPIWIGITATNGKSTTTWIVYSLFKHFFPQKHVWLTWNFDVPVSEVLATIIENNQLSKDHVFVVECSSFMLYKLQTFLFDYGILLNIARDHLDRHKDWEEYRDSKFNLIRSVSKFAITSQLLYDQLPRQDQSHTKVFTPYFDLSATQFLWIHNQENFAAAQLLLETYFSDIHLSLDQTFLARYISEIPPLDHRLKLLRVIWSVRFYDDGICTSSQALHAALGAFNQKLILLAGWYNKWDMYDRLYDDFVSKVWYAILFGQTAPVFQHICEQANIPFIVVNTLHDAVQEAYLYAKAQSIEIVLFSPGAASFDMFKNVYDRVGQFVHEVSILSA